MVARRPEYRAASSNASGIIVSVIMARMAPAASALTNATEVGAAPSSSITTWRPSGSDGQILFYVNQHPEDPHPTIAVGVCLPAGGPEQFSAIRAGVASFTRSSP